MAEIAIRDSFDAYLETTLAVLKIKPRLFNTILAAAKQGLTSSNQEQKRALVLSFGLTLTYLLRMRPASTAE